MKEGNFQTKNKIRWISVEYKKIIEPIFLWFLLLGNGSKRKLQLLENCAWQPALTVTKPWFFSNGKTSGCVLWNKNFKAKFLVLMPLFYRQVSSTKRKPTLQKSRFLASVSVRLLTLLAIHKNPFNFFSKYSFKLYFLANGRARKYHRNFVHQIQLELFFATARFKFNSFENSTFIKHSNWIICEWRTKISTEDLLLPKHVFYS